MGRLQNMWMGSWMPALLLLAAASDASGQTASPSVEHMELHLRLDPPGGFSARARVELAGLQVGRVGLLLNKGLRVTSANGGDGAPVSFQHGWRNPFGRYHKEGRTVLFQWETAPPDGRAVLEIEYAGSGESGDEGPDWRGILFVDTDQIRMSEQTIFYPQIALGAEGPRIQRSTAEVWVDLPDDLEVFVPGELVERAPGTEPGRSRWHYRSERPTVLSLIAGHLERSEVHSDGGQVTLLLRPEHRALADDLAREAQAAMEFFGRQFGASTEEKSGLDRMGIVEIDCRAGTSINWASQGVAAFDRGAFGNGVPVRKIAHEVAHLWWGQRVGASGPGERFLTESLAEYSAWRYLGTHSNRDLEHEAVERAHARYGDTARRGNDRGLAHVTFATPGYSALAYSKGPLVLRFLEHGLGRESLDRALELYARSGKEPTLETFMAALTESAPDQDVHDEWFQEDGHPRFELVGVERAPTGVVSGTVMAYDWFAGRLPAGEIVLGLTLEGGRVQRHTLILTGERTPFEIPGDGLGIRLDLDPDRIWPGCPKAAEILEGVRLVASDPEQGQNDVPFGGGQITLHFDQAMAAPDLESLSRAQWRDGRAGPVLLDCALDGNSLTLRTSPLRPDEKYSIKLGELLFDRRGAPVTTETLEFRTSASDDHTPARVVESYPEQGARDVPVNVGEVTFTLDGQMDASRGFKKGVLRSLTAEGLTFPPFDRMDWDESYRVLTCRLERLEPATRYVIPLRGTLFHDVSGNALEDFDLIFETAAD